MRASGFGRMCNGVRVYLQTVKMLSFYPEGGRARILSLCFAFPVAVFGQFSDRRQAAGAKDQIQPFHDIGMHLASFFEGKQAQLFVNGLGKIGGLLLDAGAPGR